MGGCATKPKDLSLIEETLPTQSSPERPPVAVEDDPASDKVSDQNIRGDDAKGQKDPPSNSLETEQEILNSGRETKEGLHVSQKNQPNLIDLNDPATDSADGKKAEVDSAKVSNIINGEVETKNQIKDKTDEAAKIVKNSETVGTKVSNIINGEVETKNQIKDKTDESAKVVKNSETVGTEKNSKEKEVEIKKSDVPQHPSNSESSEKKDFPLIEDKKEPMSLISA